MHALVVCEEKNVFSICSKLSMPTGRSLRLSASGF